ncbi:hypothetical protein FB567DRAFT_629810 [Paraphoma chrysanthemicola]|uniref:Uncharacterized protein n=1 Tax=Paraphoma chrysanthemicola TaxID=798071 RepID=A0A8K0VX61_9PLEO|nr:hypothetical protein FB567DRAFT_629810 [Paraphoma chrysanthemicola]
MQDNDSSSTTKTYWQRYKAAAKLFNKDTEKCIADAKENLNEMYLPPYYIIKNCILICCAMDYWSDANINRLTAESAYSVAWVEATRMQDEGALKVLEDLRADLDELEAFRQEDLYVGPPEEDEEENDIDDGYVSMDEMEAYEYAVADEEREAPDEEEEIAEVENEVEVAADS